MLLTERAKERVTKAVTEAVAGALPGMMDAAMPELPSATGGLCLFLAVVVDSLDFLDELRPEYRRRYDHP